MRTSIAKRLVLLVATVPAMLFGVVMVAAPADAAVVSTAKLEGDIVYLSNKQRVAHGCKALHADTRLAAAGRGQSVFMASTGSFSHIGRSGITFDARIRAAGFSRPMAENIAWGYRSGVDVVKAWMASPEHRANLLNCKAVSVGVGAAYAANGNPYFTQDFGY
jgi:uncharacterized protein YkwD